MQDRNNDRMPGPCIFVICFYISSTFNEEFNHEYNKHYYPSLQQRIEQYLKGLPGCCSITFADYNILQIGIKWGVLSGTDDKKACKFVDNFFAMCALRIIQAANKVGINFNMYL